MADIKLQALDAEDLAVLSALVQDAVVRSADIAYLREPRRLALVCNRFDWDSATTTSGKASYERRRAGLRVERVTGARFKGFGPASEAAVLVLLAVTFTPTVAPAGVIEFQFAAGAAIRLDVECIELELKDLGAVWSTTLKPDHTGADSDAADPAPKSGS